jgi:hypothetical protein
VTGEEFAQQLQTWKQELIAEVIAHYHANQRERGRLAFERWKERFTAFLENYVPSEAERFRRITHHIMWVIKSAEHPYETFMREDGKNCLAFIDDLADSSMRGRITFSQENTPELIVREGDGEEVREEIENLKSLISKHKQRLQILKEQEAIQGLSVDPKVPIEIKDVEMKIKQLQAKIKSLQK